MDWLDAMNDALDYIEEHLTIKLDLNQVARRAQCSVYNFQRLFSYISGISLSAYIRRRCMTQAALDIEKSNQSILEIALTYGYDSPVSFARAFQKTHGITPQDVRKGHALLQSYARISFQITIQGDCAMQYQIETVKPFTLAGKARCISTEDGKNFKEIPKFWEDVCSDGTCEKIFGMNHREKEEMYGVCYDFKFDENTFKYMIAAKPEQDIPDSMEILQIPELTWAKFSCKGIDEMQQVTKRIFTEWLPNSGYEHADGPEIEWYSAEDTASKDYHCEVWIPICKR